MGVPGWLLRIVMAFLKGRKMQMNLKGKFSGIKSLPGNYFKLALLLFIVLTSYFARKNGMRIISHKTKFILLNPCTSIDFMPGMQFENNEPELVM